jgi:hypothetical protein
MNNSHNTWLRSLDFYKSELNILKAQLAEIVGKNTGQPAMQKAELFENQLAVQTANIDSMSHSIRENLANISAEAKNRNAGYIDGDLFTRHNNLEQGFETEQRIINDLRQNFHRFAAEWM